MLKLHWRRIRSRYPWLQMIQTWRCWVLVLFAVILVLYVVVTFQKRPVTFLEEEIREIKLGNIDFDFQTGLYFLKEGNDVYLRGSFPDSLQLKGPPTHCGAYNASKRLCAEWYPHVKLEVFHKVEEHASCQSITWTPIYNSYHPQTCFSMADSHWYGGSLLSNQEWPLNKASLPLQPFVTHDLKSYQGETNKIGNILEWFWISSSGVAVMLDSSTPLHVSVNQSGDNLLCFYSMSAGKSVLKYKLCKAANLRKIHSFVTSKMFHLPTSLLPRDVFSKPIWSSDPLFNHRLNQDNIMKYAKEVTDQSFDRYAMELYDESINLFKSDAIDMSKFPNAHQMLMYLRGDYGFKVFVSISPFLSANETQYKSKLILDSDGSPLVTNWNGEEVCIVNLFDTQVFDWFAEKAKMFKELYGIDGIRLVGGESSYLSLKTLDSVAVDKLSKLFTQFAAEVIKLPVITTFASSSQKTASFTLITSHDSSWGSKGGLQSVIPSVLTLGILGYPFVIPNIIGGPGSVNHVNASYSEHIKVAQELYVRWMAVAAYMPIMLFSDPPWAYDQEVKDIAKEFVRIHKEVVSPLVIKAAREFEISGSPIIRPLWWIDPTDATSQTVFDEYLIGDSLLVAPILQQGKSHRDVYIPQGRWMDEINKREVEGKIWLRDFLVGFNQVATFSILKS